MYITVVITYYISRYVSIGHHAMPRSMYLQTLLNVTKDRKKILVCKILTKTWINMSRATFQNLNLRLHLKSFFNSDVQNRARPILYVFMFLLG